MSIRYLIATVRTNVLKYCRDLYGQMIYMFSKRRNAASLRRIDTLPIHKIKSEIRLFAIMRNESLRLPYFHSYYQGLGVDRFFFIDNNSTDSSREIILSKINSHLFVTEQSYRDHWYWLEYMLDRFGRGHWCLVVDIDELFQYPHSDTVSLKDFCKFLDSKGDTAVRSMLLDMYSDVSCNRIEYAAGQNPLDVLRYFDPTFDEISATFFDRHNWRPFRAKTYVGGVRDRVFRSKMPNHLSKISLFKFMPDSYLTQGMHAINCAQVSDIQGITFHTKFLQDFVDEVYEESRREEHFGNAIVYKIIKEVISVSPEFTFYSDVSVKLENISQLFDLGFLRSSADFDSYALELKNQRYSV